MPLNETFRNEMPFPKWNINMTIQSQVLTMLICILYVYYNAIIESATYLITKHPKQSQLSAPCFREKEVIFQSPQTGLSLFEYLCKIFHSCMYSLQFLNIIKLIIEVVLSTQYEQTTPYLCTYILMYLL